MPIFGAFPSDYHIVSTNIDGGNNTLGFVTTGINNIGLGNNSLALLTSGQNNVAVGNNALSSITTKVQNVAVGVGALQFDAGFGGFNVALGWGALGGANAFGVPIAVTVDGSSNTAVGFTALMANSTGSGNVGIGSAALRGDIIGSIPVTGSNNTGVGALSLSALSSGSNNVAVGSQAGKNITTGSNNILVGNNSFGTAALANTIQIGDLSHTSVTVGGISLSGLSSGAFPAGIGVGGATPQAGGVAFPAVAVAVADANTLDDYEEGTFTPILTCATPGDLAVAYLTQSGVYVKIGRNVFFSISISTTSITRTTAAGAVFITGLPFARNSGTAGGGTGISFAASRWTAPAGFTSLFGDVISTQVNLNKLGNADAVLTPANITEFTTGAAQFLSQGYYRTT